MTNDGSEIKGERSGGGMSRAVLLNVSAFLALVVVLGLIAVVNYEDYNDNMVYSLPVQQHRTNQNTRGGGQQPPELMQQASLASSSSAAFSQPKNKEERVLWEDEDGEFPEYTGGIDIDIDNSPRRRLTTTENLMDTSTCQPEVEPLVGKKKVLVTGGGGFIGSHVAEALLERGDDVVIVDEMNDYYDPAIKWTNIRNLQKKYGVERCKFFQYDFTKFDPMWNIFKKEKIQFVAHIGARAGVRPSIENPYLYIHSNIKGTTKLLEVARLFSIQNFVYASSSSVYGLSQSTKFKEDEKCDKPVSPYAATKRSTELLAHSYSASYQLNVTGLRFFTVFGPRGRPDMAPFKFVDRVSQRQSIDMFGDGRTSRDYTYIDDIVNGVVRALDRPHKTQVFNLGQGGGAKLAEFIGLVEKHTGKKAIINRMPMQLGDVPYTSADVSKAYCYLGYVPTVTLDEGLRKTVEWYNATYLTRGGYKAVQKEKSFAELSVGVSISKAF
mmetsp:Transcript_22068/g.36527  ORF Transcript_22068/g.36527 Transcript_22068/m.36527 type:complete len:496 (+) Transcript_22068:107-1594(+)